MLSLIEDTQILILEFDCLCEPPYSSLFSVTVCKKNASPHVEI